MANSDQIELQRIRAIVNSRNASGGNEALAKHLAVETAVPIEQALKILSAAATSAKRSKSLAEKMAEKFQRSTTKLRTAQKV